MVGFNGVGPGCAGCEGVADGNAGSGDLLVGRVVAGGIGISRCGTDFVLGLSAPVSQSAMINRPPNMSETPSQNIGERALRWRAYEARDMANSSEKVSEWACVQPQLASRTQDHRGWRACCVMVTRADSERFIGLKPPVIPADIISRIEKAMLSDRPELLRRASAIGWGVGSRSPTGEREHAELSAGLERSIRRASARASLIPKATFDPALPVSQRVDEIAGAIRDHQVVVIAGATGSGKTTQIPKICMTLGRGVHGNIAHTQPRRIAARTVAARIADELNVKLGEQVGFKVRFSDRTSGSTLLTLLTDGLLLAEATSSNADPDLLAYDTIIIDEAHERSLNIDFLLGYLKRLLPRRPELKVIITSATIDPARFAAHFKDAVARGVVPVIEVSGRTFPVEHRYRPVTDDEELQIEVEAPAIVDAVDELCSPSLPKGDILVFLPGEREIRQTAEAIRRDGPAGLEILPLYARLTEAEQDRVFSPTKDGPRRVVLATNVAETSLTVPGIRYVIDTGLVRTARYDARKKVDRLPIEMVSQAAANQRSGRCGRVAAGVCIRLYGEEAFNKQPLFTDPEIRRTDLASVILRCKAMELGPIDAFPFLDPPEPHAVRDGLETLFELGAIASASAAEPLTALGRRLALFPTEPRLARVLLASVELGCVDAALVLASALCIQDPLQRPLGREQHADAAHSAFRSEKSDFVTLLNLWRQHESGSGRDGLSGMSTHAWCREHFVSAARMREWAEVYSQLRQVADDAGLLAQRGRVNAEVDEHDAVHRALLSGMVTSVLCRDDAGGGNDYLGIRGNRASIFPGSSLFKKRPKWILAAEVVQTSRLFARTIAPIDPAWIEEAAPHMFQRQISDAHLDADTLEPACFEKVTLSGLTVSPRRRAMLAELDPAAARRLVIQKLLVENLYPTTAQFAMHNAAVLAHAESLKGKLRRAEGLIDQQRLGVWFESRLPAAICSRKALDQWLADPHNGAANCTSLCIRPEDALTADVPAELDRLFPDALDLGELVQSDAVIPLSYAIAPGQETDGVTATVPLLALHALSDDRAAWLVPGLLQDKIAALLKLLPKAALAALQAILAPKASTPAAAIAAAARDLSGVVNFGIGSLAAAMTEAAEVLASVAIDQAAWNLDGVPEHLRLRVQVVDEHAKPIAAGRDLAELRARLAGRIARAQAGAAKRKFARQGLLTWDFDSLPESVQVDAEGPAAHPALVDEISSVSLTLMPTGAAADLSNRAGVRRLFVLATGDELDHRLEVTDVWAEMVKHFTSATPLGDAAELRDAAKCIIAERAFMVGQSPVRDRHAFDDRLQQQWGRLGQVSIEVAGVIARMLEPRYRVAVRLGSGTRAQWAASIADIREHAAYLMPPGFLHALTWERIARYPVYAQAMRDRLLKLREDGSVVETEQLRLIGPHWKRFTGWVAAAMSRERKSLEVAMAAGGERGESLEPGKSGARKGPLPMSRKAAAIVNTDAGAWAMQPGRLPAALESYRWMLEDYRVALFAPEMLSGPAVTAKMLDELWARVPAV